MISEDKFYEEDLQGMYAPVQFASRPDRAVPGQEK